MIEVSDCLSTSRIQHNSWLIKAIIRLIRAQGIEIADNNVLNLNAVVRYTRF